VPGHVLLAHGGRQPPLELAEQLSKTRVMLAITYLVLCCGRTYVTRLGVALGDTGHLRSLDAT
jgi:hypothetical protein